MSIFRTTSGPHMASRLRLGVSALMLVALAGCDQVGNPIAALGGEKPTPDEFRVLPRKPLVVPENLTVASGALPTPDPGRTSPLTPDPSTEAVAALLGENATRRPVADPASLSTGERALLSSAAASAASPDIRVQLEQDRIRAEQEEAEGPYEPPTLVELLGFGSDSEEEEIDPEIALDPIAESQRLQREGIASTYDPLATAPVEEAATPGVGTGAPVEPYYPSTTDRRPTNRVTGRDVAPAFE